MCKQYVIKGRCINVGHPEFTHLCEVESAIYAARINIVDYVAYEPGAPDMYVCTELLQKITALFMYI